MSEERPRRVRALFEQAADLPPPEQKALLDACCAADPDLRARVEHLLACDAQLRAGAGAGALLDSRLVRVPQQAAAEGCPSTAEDPGVGGESASGAEVAALPAHLGRYKLLEEIGRGGMGSVLRGHDPELGRDLAVKLLLPEHQHDPAMVRRFTEEAQIGGQLQHPGIVPVHEIGRSADQQPYFTMKLVRGRTLAELLKERPGPADDLPRLLQVFEQVCQTLAYAHSRGVIHRDLKPSNVMVGAFGEVQVMDWGLAKVLTRGGEPPPADVVRTVRSAGAGDKTRPGWVAGTPAYMAPEQAAGEIDRLDQRCDVFGLGAILCEILTGRPPYVGADDMEVFSRAVRADLAEAFARLDGCGADAELLRLARASLAAEPSARPRDAGVLAAEMAAYRESMATRLRQAEVAQAEARARAAEERKRHRLRLGLAASVLLTALLAGGAWLWLQRARDVRDRQALDALARAELLREQAQAGTDPGEWADALAQARRAEALLEQGTGRPEAAERARVLLQVLEGEEADRRLLARVDEIQFVKVKVASHVFNFGLRGAVPQYAEAFEQYGLKAGAVPAEQAAARIGQRPPAVQTRIIWALDDWSSLLWEPGDADTARWVEAVLKAADPDPWRQRLRAARGHNDQRELQRLAGEADVARQSPWTMMLLGKALGDGGSPRQGLALMRRAQGRYPGDFWVNFELANQLERDPDRTDDPVRFYRIAVALRPDSPVVRFFLANALTGRGEVDKAAAVLQEGIALQPDLAAFHVNLGYCLSWTGQRDEAIAAYRRATELEPDLAAAHAQLGLALDDRGDRAGLDEVLARVRRLVKRKPNDPAAYSALGDLLLRKNDPQGARDAFRRAKDATGRDDFDAHFNMGRHLKDQRLFDEALATFRYCEELAARKKRPELGERAARAARETEQLPLLTAGREHAGRREWGQAARCYAQLLNRDKDQNSEVCFENADVLLLSGDRDGYRRAGAGLVERAGKEKEFFPAAYLAARACTLAPDSLKEMDRAGQVAEQGLKASPDAAWLQTEQAALHYRAGRFDQALPLLEQSLKGAKKPGNAVLNWLWLALTCHKLGRKAQARTWLETATKWLDQYRDGLPPRAEQDLGLHLHNWLEAHVLRAEAETLLGAR
jgi:serine/threonine-protein kinase